VTLTKLERVHSGAPWEGRVGYCRAVRADGRVFVSGTAPVEPDGSVTAPGDGYRQALRCLTIIGEALAKLGLGMDRVTRTRMFVTDIDRWADYGRAHAEVFGSHPPATTMVEVRRLIHPDILIEIEADAVE
jgi:isochorismate pyruvate lyase